MGYSFPQQKLTRKQKAKNNFAWGKNVLDEIDKYNSKGFDGRLDNTRKKINYDIYNGQIDRDDYEYVCKPYGVDGVGELPAELRHYDITTPKLRVLLGEEIKRPFNYKLIATNSEAITEKERERMRMIAEYVKESIMSRVNAMVAQEAEKMQAGTPQESMNPEAQQQMDQQLQQLQQSMTPPEIEEYMKRDYAGAREIQGQQILDYLIRKEKVKEKFSKGWKHALIAGEEIYWTGIVNGEPTMRTVNPLYFDYDKDPDLDYIQDGQWAKYIMRMTPGSVIDTFGEYLTDRQIKDLYSDTGVTGANHIIDETFGEFSYDHSDTFDLDNFGSSGSQASSEYIRVVHCEWRSLRKLGFLKFIDDKGVPQETIVDDTYVKDESKGDIEVKWEWIPEIWEGTKIEGDIYVNIRPKPNQYKDLDNLYSCKLGYIGIAYNNLNSRSVSVIDRIKPYQYMYNIIMYRLEMDLASDKGKKFLADINQIPSDLGMDMQKWMYYFDAMGIAWVNPHEEGNRGKPHSFNQWQAVDLSMAQTVQQKIQLLEYLEMQSGEVAGVTKQREGQMGPREGLGTSQQAIVQSSHITEDLFSTHAGVKKAVLESLIETAKVAWSQDEETSGSKKQSKKIQYVLDDMSVQMLSIDPDVFTNSSYGIFVSDSGKDQETFMVLRQLAQAALQNQRAELSDVIKMFSTQSTAELKTILEKAEESRKAQEQAMQQAQQQSQERMAQAKQEQERQEMMLDKYKVDEDNATKLEIARMKELGQQQALDLNRNKIPDIMEVEKFKQEAENDRQKNNIEQQKLNLKARELDIKSRDVQKKEKENKKK